MKCWPLLLLLLAPQPAQEVEITAEPHHHQVFVNNEVRVFTVEVPAHGETLMHRHGHDYISVIVGAAQVVNTVKGKDPVTLKLNDGDTFFLPAPFVHAARNLSDTPMRSVAVELLQDEKLRKAHPQKDSAVSNQDRGLEILEGGTKDVLWTKDGVRASEVELQPGGMLPSSPKPRPYLLVALSDCEIGSAAKTLSLKTGEAKWIPSTESHSLKNSGHHLAKFVTLELP